MRHTISALVEKQVGVLVRIAGMFSGRGFNIDTLNVAPTQMPRFAAHVVLKETILRSISASISSAN